MHGAVFKMPCRKTHELMYSNKILQQITEDFPEETFLYPTGYEDCVVGLEYSSNTLIMDANKIIDKLIHEEEMTPIDAQEFFDYNIAGSKGEGYPIYIYIPVT
jgi:hypothetical protein